MPSYSNKRTHDMTAKKWGGGGRQNQRRNDDRRSGSMQHRISGGSRPMVNPWENGVAPGMQSSMLNQNYSQPFTNSYLVSSGMNRGNFVSSSYGGGYGNNSNKMRRLERMGSFDDQRGRGLLPSPSNTPLLGVAPPSFPHPGRGPEFLQQRMSNPWESFRSGGPRGMSSGYYPSNRGRQDNSRKFLKAKRPTNKNSSSSANSREGRGGRGKGSASNKTPSTREREDKEKDSSHSKELKSKQGEQSPQKRERSSDKSKDEDGKDETEVMETEENENEEAKREEGDEGKDTKEEKEKGKEKIQEEPFPVQALYCHICELDSFSTKKGYIRHLQGITHAKMAELFHAKNAATLELLNISAKLAEMRQRDKTLRRTGKKNQPIMKTTEQILVQKWLKVGSCCGNKYKSPFGLEEHKLSIHHLRAKYLQTKSLEEKEKPEKVEGKSEEKSEEKEEEEKGEEDEETKVKAEKTEDEQEEEEDEEEEETKVKRELKEEPSHAQPDQFIEDSLDEVIRISKLIDDAIKEAIDNPITMHNLPVYNPSIMIGLEYIAKELRFRCKVCKGQIFKSLENHCQSHAHFDSIASYLNKIEDMKREEQRLKEEAEEAERLKKEQEEKEKEKAEEEARKSKEKEEKAKAKANEKKANEDEEEEQGLPSDYITVDCSDDTKDKSDDEQDMDEDVIPLGEEEERILNEKEEEEEEEADVAEEDDDEEDVMLEEEIFEEVGEKIDFDDDLKKQLENGEGGKASSTGNVKDHKKKEPQDEEEEEEEDDEVEEIEPPPAKKATYTPRRRGRARGRGRWAK